MRPPDVVIKVAQIFPRVAKKYPRQFLRSIDVFKIAQKFTNIWAKFSIKIFHQEFSKIAQSNHTGHR